MQNFRNYCLRKNLDITLPPIDLQYLFSGYTLLSQLPCIFEYISVLECRSCRSFDGLE